MNKFIAENNKLILHPKNSEEVAIKNVGQDLYNLIFKHYTYKQWNKYPIELDPSVLSRIPIRNNCNPYYFNDKYEALPKYGYTYFIKKMLDHPNITVKLNTEYTKDMKQELKYSKIFFTGPIDHYYSELNLPKLEYRSINFVKEYHNIDYYQSNSVINYPLVYSHIDNNIIKTPWTRIIEYKHFYNQIVPNKTVIVKEYTTDVGEPYYPIPTKRNQDLYVQYQKEALKDEENNIYFLGRLGSYKYLNMDQAIEQALLLAEKFIKNI
jgi:UDP-galactopyranose mutase